MIFSSPTGTDANHSHLARCSTWNTFFDSFFKKGLTNENDSHLKNLAPPRQ